jgi:DNA-binding winged helix-turn-helix (wHTH) protein
VHYDKSVFASLAVSETGQKPRIFRFGIFELDGDTGEIRREGKAQPRLRDQSLRILRMLLDRPGDLVTREELRQRLWSSDTFVDFDHGLNTAINQLRGAFNDSAANPRFIQTLPRRGYRFIAPVEIASAGEPIQSRRMSVPSVLEAPVRNTEPPVQQNAPPARSSLLSDSRELPPVSSGVVRVLFSLIQLMYLAFYVISLWRLPEVETILAELGNPTTWTILLVVTAAIGVPIRLYLFSAMAFNYQGLSGKFRMLFPFVLPLDELWALAPFLLFRQIGIGLAIGLAAALLYLPFAQRSLLLMGFSTRQPLD